MTVRTLAALTALLPAMILAACNGGDDDATPTASPSETAPLSTATTPATAGTPTPVASATAMPFTGSTSPVTVAAPAGLLPPIVQAIRIAAQPGFDRLVFEFSGDKVPGYSVQYATKAVGCGSGEDLTNEVGGGKAPAAMLIVKMQPANGHSEAGQATVPKEINAGLSSIVRAFGICDFEADVQYAVALTAQKPFKVSTLTNPSRMVIDIGQ